jgi:hypothetical protein
MPAVFGEVLLRVYTRDARYVIIASYPPVYGSALDIGIMELFKPGIVKFCRRCLSQTK